MCRLVQYFEMIYAKDDNYDDNMVFYIPINISKVISGHFLPKGDNERFCAMKCPTLMKGGNQTRKYEQKVQKITLTTQ